MSKTKNRLFQLALGVSALINGRPVEHKPETEFHLAQITGVFPATPRDDRNLAGVRFIDSMKQTIDEPVKVELTQEACDKYKLKGKNHAAPNRFVVLELEKSGEDIEYKKLVQVRSVDTTRHNLNHWQTLVDEANTRHDSNVLFRK